MADEIHETRTPEGTTNRTTIVEREPRPGAGWSRTLILLAFVAVAAFFAFQFLANERTESGAITEAAQKVGNAADAAQKAVE